MINPIMVKSFNCLPVFAGVFSTVEAQRPTAELKQTS
jgi:hypothetical protein